MKRKITAATSILIMILVMTACPLAVFADETEQAGDLTVGTETTVTEEGAGTSEAADKAALSDGTEGPGTADNTDAADGEKQETDARNAGTGDPAEQDGTVTIIGTEVPLAELPVELMYDPQTASKSTGNVKTGSTAGSGMILQAADTGRTVNDTAPSGKVTAANTEAAYLPFQVLHEEVSYAGDIEPAESVREGMEKAPGDNAEELDVAGTFDGINEKTDGYSQIVLMGLATIAAACWGFAIAMFYRWKRSA